MEPRLGDGEGGCGEDSERRFGACENANVDVLEEASVKSLFCRPQVEL